MEVQAIWLSPDTKDKPKIWWDRYVSGDIRCDILLTISFQIAQTESEMIERQRELKAARRVS